MQSGFLHRNAAFGAYVDRTFAACTASGPIWPGHLRLAASPALAAAVMAGPSPGQGCGASELAQRLVGEGLQDALSPRRALHPLPANLSRSKIVQDLFFQAGIAHLVCLTLNPAAAGIAFQFDPLLFTYEADVL